MARIKLCKNPPTVMQINPPIVLAFRRQRCLLQFRTCLARVNNKYNSSHGFAVLIHLATMRYIYKYFRVILIENWTWTSNLFHAIFRIYRPRDIRRIFLFDLNISKIGDNLLIYCSEISRHKIGDIQPANQVFARKVWKIIRSQTCF